MPWYLRPVNRSFPIPPSHPGSRERPSNEDDNPGRTRRLRHLLIGAGILALLAEAAVLLGGASRLHLTGGTELDVTKVQAGVAQTLSDPANGYGANTVSEVSCNGGRNPSAAKGTTFTCDATVNGARRHVGVLVSDDNGTYEVDGPR